MIYKMEWNDYDSAIDYLFEHDDKTEEQFKADCIKAIRAVGEKYLSDENGWISAPDWIEIAAKKMIDYGYRPVNPITWSHFGSDIIGDFEYDEDYRLRITPISKGDEKWKEIVGGDLFKKSLEKNFVVEKNLHGYYIREEKRRHIVEDLQRMRFL